MTEWHRNIILLIVFALVLGVGLMSIPYDGSNILILYVLIASVAVVAVVGHNDMRVRSTGTVPDSLAPPS